MSNDSFIARDTEIRAKKLKHFPKLLSCVSNRDRCKNILGELFFRECLKAQIGHIVQEIPNLHLSPIQDTGYGLPI